MSLKGFFGKQLLDIIEWEDTTNDTLVYKFPMQDNEIQNGAQLTVRPGQHAIFVEEGEIADVFSEGMYRLETANLPILGDLKGWAFGFKSPFKADVYFINTKKFIDQKWGTPSPIWINDPRFEQVEVRAFGTFGFRIAEPEQFLRTVSSTNKIYKVNELKGQLKEFILSEFSTVVAKQGVSITELAQNYQIMNTAMKQELEEEFKNMGLEIILFTVSNISLPEDLTKFLKERTRINMMGGMDNYRDVRKLDALEKVSENEGSGGDSVQAGMGLGAGLGFGNILAQSFQQPPQQQQQPNQSNLPNQSNNQPPNQGVPCKNCQHTMPEGAKFCSNCGEKAEQTAKKFCTECGHQNAPNAKFCEECGNKIG